MKDTITLSFRCPYRLHQRLEAQKDVITEKHYPMAARVTTAHLVRAAVLEMVQRLEAEQCSEK